MSIDSFLRCFNAINYDHSTFRAFTKRPIKLKNPNNFLSKLIKGTLKTQSLSLRRVEKVYIDKRKVQTIINKFIFSHFFDNIILI